MKRFCAGKAVMVAAAMCLMVTVTGCQDGGDKRDSQMSSIEKRIDSLLNEKKQNSTDREMLHELQIIRGLQEASHKEREDAKQKRLESGEKIPVGGEYDAMFQIADNTQTDWTFDGWTLFGILTFVVALISCIYSIVTYKAQEKTERHTTNAPVEVQLSTLRDLPRHFYRNLVCTSAIIHAYRADSEDGEGHPIARSSYPSENHLYKLETLPDDVVLSIDIVETADQEANPYTYMHELKLLLRNYCTEVKVASHHLSRQNIVRESLLQDFDNLLFKPLFLVTKSLDYRTAVEQQLNDKRTTLPAKLKTMLRISKATPEKPSHAKASLVFECLKDMVEEHLKKLSEKDNFNCLFRSSASNLLNIIDKKGYNDYINMNEPKSVDRSVSKLLSYGYDKNNTSPVQGLIYSEEEKAMLLRQLLTDKLADKQKTFLADLIAITTQDDFIAFCANHQFGKPADGNNHLAQLYGQLTPYISVLQQEQWDVHTLLKTILAVDTAIETTRIGRVNF